MRMMKLYAFVAKPGNRAKYGADAPREGYIHAWEDVVPMGMSDEDADDWSEEMRVAARAQAREWLGYDLP